MNTEAISVVLVLRRTRRLGKGPVWKAGECFSSGLGESLPEQSPKGREGGAQGRSEGRNSR